MRRLLVALLVASLALVLAPAAEARAGVRLTASDTTPIVDTRVTLTARVGDSGRAVVFEKRYSGGWTTIGRTRSDSRGVARVVTRFDKAGEVDVRATAGQDRDQITLTVKKVPTTVTPDFAASPWGVGVPIQTPVVVQPATVGRKVWLERLVGDTWTKVTEPVTTDALGEATLVWTPPEIGTETLRARVGATATRAGDVSPAVEREITLASSGFVYDGGLESTHEGRDAPGHQSQLFAACLGGAPPPAGPVPSFAAARQQAHDYVLAQMSGRNTDAWEALSAQSDAALLDQVAAIAVADGRYAGALAASLRAHELDPGDGTHLSNAAAAANLVNHPEWAVAFATKAADAGPAPSLGVRQEAVRLVNLGHAHALRQEWVLAEQALRDAVAVHPASQAVQAELGAFLTCRDAKAAALEHVRRSLRTDDTPDPIEDRPGEADTRVTRLDTSTVYDVSGGADQSLTLPYVPASWGEVAARSRFYDGNSYYDDQYQAVQDRMLELVQRQSTLQQQLAVRQQGWAPARARLVDDILRRIGTSYESDLRDAWETYVDVKDTVISPNNCHGMFATHVYCGVEAVDDDCGLTQTVFNEWTRGIEAHGDALSAFHDAAAQHLSGLQALLKDAVAHELAGVKAELVFLVDVFSMVSNMRQSADLFATYNEEYDDRTEEDPPCVGVSPPQQPDPAVATEREAATICSDGSPFADLDLNLDLEIVAVQLGCEGWVVEVSRGVPWLEAFASVSGQWNGTNGVTVNVGIRGGVAGAGVEAALYWEQGGEGKVMDFGWQAGTSLGVGGIVSMTPYENTVKVSLMSTFTQG